MLYKNKFFFTLGKKLKKILFIDHKDSFSYNLVNWFRAEGINVYILDYQLLTKDFHTNFFSGIVLSPGPGHPLAYPDTLEFYQRIPKQIPVLGVCLGHQIMLTAEGGNIQKISSRPVHGRQVYLQITQTSRLLPSWYSPAPVVMYNSLGCFVQDDVFKKSMNCLSETENFCLISEHISLPRLSLQFHPESFASPGGDFFLNAFLRLL